MSYFDCSDAEGLDLGDSEEVNCIHGVDLFEPCAKCKPMAANGGEESDDMDPDKLMEGGSLSLEQQQQIVNDWIDAAPVRELKRIKIRVDLVVAQRRAVLEQESKELAAWEKPVRARRSDAGRPRQKPANDIPRDEKGVAV